jgi:hypothetical protein
MESADMADLKKETKIDRKGIIAYLIITFGLTYIVDAILIFNGIRFMGTWSVSMLYGQLAVAVTMWMPAAATVITVKFITREGFGITNLRIGALKPYLISALIIPSCFIIIYGLTWLLGFARPDWHMKELGSMINQKNAVMPTTTLVIPVLFLVTFLFGPLYNGLWAFGEELGWRGYLLPKLMPLGKFKAYLLLGVIWGLWHAPVVFIGFNYPGHPVIGIFFMISLTIFFGIYINELSLCYQSTFLAAWIHGAFNGQSLGIWRQIFPNANPLLAGFTGIIGLAVWLVLGLWQIRRK